MQSPEDIIGEGFLVPLKTLGKSLKTHFGKRYPVSFDWRLLEKLPLFLL